MGKVLLTSLSNRCENHAASVRCRLGSLIWRCDARSMNRTLFFLIVLSIAQVFAADSPAPRFPPISSYLAETTFRHDAHGASGGCTDYVVPAEVAKLIETRTIHELLAAIILDTNDPTPLRLGRIADLTVIVLARVKAVNDGWMSKEDRESNAKVFRIPFPIDRALRRGFPRDADGWRDYYKAVGTTFGK